MAHPSAQELIQAATGSQFRQIVVQPHLLFHGELLDRLEASVRAIAGHHADKTWRTTRVLGEEASPLAQILLQVIAVAGNIQEGARQPRWYYALVMPVKR